MDPLFLILLALLIALSGCFSASETALFSLSAGQRERAGPVARRLLERPRDLLVTILLANLVVNVLFFAFARRLEDELGPLAAGLGALLAVIVLGEILPKALALRGAVFMARILALPLSVLVALLRPVRFLINRVLEAFFRLLGPAPRDERITSEMLSKALEKSAEEGLFDGSEAELLSEVLELAEIRVREIMTPRVDMLVVDRTKEENRDAVVREALARLVTWLPVVEESADNVVGQVSVRDLLAYPDRPLGRLVMPVKFVPEVASCLSLLATLREDRTSEAVVVDEWGGTAGVVTIEDVLEEIVGELRVEGERRERPVVPLGEGRFRVSGSLSIREWNELFGFGFVPTEFETVGGLVTALLGRIPRVGDRVRFGDLVAEVQELRSRRPYAVDIFVEAEEVPR